jgi:hypothetical protein
VERLEHQAIQAIAEQAEDQEHLDIQVIQEFQIVEHQAILVILDFLELVVLLDFLALME